MTNETPVKEQPTEEMEMEQVSPHLRNNVEEMAANLQENINFQTLEDNQLDPDLQDSARQKLVKEGAKNASIKIAPLDLASSAMMNNDVPMKQEPLQKCWLKLCGDRKRKIGWVLFVFSIVIGLFAFIESESGKLEKDLMGEEMGRLKEI